jgi:hypothetical protein
MKKKNTKAGMRARSAKEEQCSLTIIDTKSRLRDWATATTELMLSAA